MKPFGKEAVINLCGCNKKIENMQKVKEFIQGLTREIEMVPHGPTRVERFGEGSLEGISGFQFIETSSIVVHCDEVGRRVFINCFSCQDFDAEEARQYAKDFFRAKDATLLILTR